VLACVQSATLLGVEGRSVAVEVHVSSGFPGYTVVGLPDAAIRESRDRVRAALLSSGFTWPQRRVTVNLAPSGVRKGGAGLDLPIAVGLLTAMGELPAEAVARTGFVGELGLDGSIRAVPGTVSLVGAIRTPTVVVAAASVPEARLVARRRIRWAPDLRGLVLALLGRAPWPVPPPSCRVPPGPAEPDLADVRGQVVGRRALEIAAAGGHNLLLVGPPGSGKTMLATRLPGLLPPLGRDEAFEVCRVHSAAGVGHGGAGLPTRPPFRAPHHSATAVSVIGGGSSWLRPGEVSLAHCGVLFLDELGEFPAGVLDMLRQPLEERVIRISRARATVELPARFQLVGAMNPCPCGEGVTWGSCRCTDHARQRYARRLSGPLLDRFDLAVALDRPAVDDVLDGPPGEPSAVVARRVALARAQAVRRGVRTNAELPATCFDRDAPLTTGAAALLEQRLRSGVLSVRGLHRVRRVARTIADLDGGGARIDERHVAEALHLRAGRSVLLVEAAR